MTNPYQTLVYKRSHLAPVPKEKSLVLSLGQNLTLELFFHIIQSEQITLATDITDHIVEDHTSVQDHITIKPRTFTMKGLITEKVYIHPDSIEVDLPKEQLDKKLKKLGTLMPIMSSYVSSAVNAFEAIGGKLYGIGLKAYNSVVAVINGLKDFQKSLQGLKPVISVDVTHKRWSPELIQASVIQILDYYRVNRIPLSVNTGWGMELKDNYYITDISVTQGDTYQQSELSVTVKELRFTDIKMVKVTNEDLRNLQQSQEMNDIVTGTGKPSSGMYNTLLDGYGKYK